MSKGPTYQYGVPTKELAGAERAAEPKSAEREMDKLISVNKLTLKRIPLGHHTVQSFKRLQATRYSDNVVSYEPL